MSFELETATPPKSCAASPSIRCRGSRATARSPSCSTTTTRCIRCACTSSNSAASKNSSRAVPYWEVPVMVQRLCGICPVSHHLAASKALDMILGVKQLTPTAEKIRRLMHAGQILQSHALHFFHLSSPDLLFGFGSDVAARNVVGVIAAHPEIAKKGVLLRKYGQEVIRMTAGKRVHGTGSVPGGVNKSLSAEERAELLKDAYQMVAWSRDAVGPDPRPVRAEPRRVQRLRPLPLRRHVPGQGRRRDGPLPRRPARTRHRRQDPVRPFRLRPLLGGHRRGRQALVLHEVPLLQVAGRRRGHLPGRPAVPRHDVRQHPDRRWRTRRARNSWPSTAAAPPAPRSATTGRA
jgi:hypothetical protein